MKTVQSPFPSATRRSYDHRNRPRAFPKAQESSMKKSLFVVILLLGASIPGTLTAEDASPQIGRQLDDFTLNDFLGTAHSLRDLDDSKLVVIAFLGTECPLARLYGPRLEELAGDYQETEVTFLGMNANRHDSVTEIASYARRHGIRFPIWRKRYTGISRHAGWCETNTTMCAASDRFMVPWRSFWPNGMRLFPANSQCGCSTILHLPNDCGYSTTPDTVSSPQRASHLPHALKSSCHKTVYR